MKTKTFDCIQMKRHGAEQVMKRLKGKTIPEQLEYWKTGTEELRKHQQDLRRHKEHSSRPN